MADEKVNCGTLTLETFLSYFLRDDWEDKLGETLRSFTVSELYSGFLFLFLLLLSFLLWIGHLHFIFFILFPSPKWKCCGNYDLKP